MELEEILTIYTRTNKSASIFLGAKPNKQTKEDVIHQEKNPATTNGVGSGKETSNESLARPKKSLSSLRQLSTAEKKQQTPDHKGSAPLYNRHNRHTSEPNKKFTRDSNTRPYSALTTDILNKPIGARNLSANSIYRNKSSNSIHRLDQMSTAICAYAGSSARAKYEQRPNKECTESGKQLVSTDD